ncbi:hypothetical protein H6P81_020480 [Aristolochia fimbriata]|uniref:BURP domain-containing protein n=1 Tax=Aristolochia fimbriata TaxID=158543 RepID=A0AAV7DUH3_ARIFI|nr:hypothetical protein H6P81_020480 [Aristolochia fimbriata]
MALRSLFCSSVFFFFFFLLPALVPVESQEIGSHDHEKGPIFEASHMVFFKIEDLRVGTQMPIFFPDEQQYLSTSFPSILSTEEPTSIFPFSPSDLPRLLHIFAIPPDSLQVQGIKFTLERCNVEPLPEEKKICATSMASMLHFVHDTLGWESRPRLLTSVRYRSSTDPSERHSSAVLQRYTILESPVRSLAPEGVACHSLPFPYKVFYCHQMRKTRVFRATLRGENGDRVEAVAVCHMDTSGWSQDHPAFLLLGVGPGTEPVCHWFREDNLIWVPSVY